VVVNDLGHNVNGVLKNEKVDEVVHLIRAANGKAVADYNNVLEGDRIVQTALNTWGKVDILINNAGILADGSFKKMTDDQWDRVIKVHL